MKPSTYLLRSGLLCSSISFLFLLEWVLNPSAWAKSLGGACAALVYITAEGGVLLFYIANCNWHLQNSKGQKKCIKMQSPRTATSTGSCWLSRLAQIMSWSPACKNLPNLGQVSKRVGSTEAAGSILQLLSLLRTSLWISRVRPRI